MLLRLPLAGDANAVPFIQQLTFAANRRCWLSLNRTRCFLSCSRGTRLSAGQPQKRIVSAYADANFVRMIPVAGVLQFLRIYPIWAATSA